MTLMQKINPVNKEEEKKKFFFDPLYNPQFEYEEHILPHDLTQYGEASDEYLSVAKKILEQIPKEYGSHAAYVDRDREPLLSRDEVEKTVKKYLAQEKIDKRVLIKFSNQTITRTSMHADSLIIRLPVEYRQEGLMGMLYHEIGTHYFRTLNDRKQVWYGKGQEFHLHPYLRTEEGLAVLNGTLPKKDKILRNQALRYFSVHYASTHSFSQLNEALKVYEPRRERRWDLCLRVKRGMKDTSQPGAFSKDQTYLAGAIEVWKWLKKNDFNVEQLYIGKVALEDLTMLSPFATHEDRIVPTFISENKEAYKKEVLAVGKTNFFV